MPAFAVASLAGRILSGQGAKEGRPSRVDQAPGAKLGALGFELERVRADAAERLATGGRFGGAGRESEAQELGVCREFRTAVPGGGGGLPDEAYAHTMRIKESVMPKYDSSVRKRPVNLTLNEDLVAHARGLTDNLSRVVEQLLADFVARAGQDREQRAKSVAVTVAAWNAHGAKHGSIADEYSPL